MFKYLLVTIAGVATAWFLVAWLKSPAHSDCTPPAASDHPRAATAQEAADGYVSGLVHAALQEHLRAHPSAPRPAPTPSPRPGPAGPADPDCKHCDNPLSYDDAYRKAMKENKALLVWVGGDFCPRCSHESRDEFVHHFTDRFLDAPKPSVVVAAREGDKLIRVADIRWWIEGDSTFGHLPSTRRALANWRATGFHQLVTEPRSYQGGGMMYRGGGYGGGSRGGLFRGGMLRGGGGGGC